METFKNQFEKFYQSMTVKMVILGFLGLLLLIPLEMVKEVIRERSAYADEARIEIGRLWAESQTITGPVLNVPGKKVISDDGKFTTTTLHILPETLNVNATINPEIRYRGIYETVVYESDVALSGSFNLKGLTELDGFTYDWTSAYFTLGVSDNKGLKGDIKLVIDDVAIDAEPGIIQADVFSRGISFPIDLSGHTLSTFGKSFSIILGLRGSESMFVSPTGKTTWVNYNSSWASPSFIGNFLPADREVTESGFTASWEVTHLNRSFPQAWTGGGQTPENDAFGTNLMLEVDHYKKSERSAKYGILFIMLTFFVLIIIEIRSSERIHIFYYVLVAFALILFFSLLSALSEHIGFSPAYLISSAATIGLLTVFFRSLLKKSWVVLTVAGMLSVLYTFIFVLLALKDYAYLAGNIGLFVLLGILMMLSSKFKLFAANSKN